MLNQRGSMPRSLRWILHAALRFAPYQHFSNTFTFANFCGWRQNWNWVFVVVFFCFPPPAHNRVPGLEKSSRFVECEVKWSSIWLRPRPLLFLPAHWPDTTHTRLCTDGSWIFHLFIYLLILCHKPKNFLLPLWTFEWEVTCTNMHYITPFRWRIVPDRQSCSLIITNLHRAGVLVLPGGLCNISVLQMQTHIYTLNPSTSWSATKSFLGDEAQAYKIIIRKYFIFYRHKFSLVGLPLRPNVSFFNLSSCFFCLFFSFFLFFFLKNGMIVHCFYVQLAWLLPWCHSR